MFGLAGVLLALQLGLRGENSFGETALGGVFKLKVEELDPYTARFKRVPQIQMRPGQSGKALMIVKDHNVAFPAMFILIQMREELPNIGALKKQISTRNSFGEDGLNRIAVDFRVLTATVFLTIKTTASELLRI